MFLLLFWLFAEPTVVENGIHSGKQMLIFEEEFRFGGGDGEYDLWSDGISTCDLDVAKDGKIYIKDQGNTRVLLFSEKGTFLRVVASEGEGPGEFSRLNYWHILDDGAVGYDMRGPGSRFIYFDKEMNFSEAVSTLDMRYIPRVINMSDDRKWIFAKAYKPNGNAADYCTILLDKNLKLIKEYWCQPWPIRDPSKENDPATWEAFMIDRFKLMRNESRFFSVFSKDGTIYQVDGNKYEIHISKDPRKTDLIVKRDFKPIPFNEETKQSWVDYFQDVIYEQIPHMQHLVTESLLKRSLEKADLSPVQFPLKGLVPAENGHFLTVHRSDLGKGTIGGHYFDANGHCLASYTFPGKGVIDVFGLRLIFRNGKAFALEKNEDGDNQVVRYKYFLK